MTIQQIKEAIAKGKTVSYKDDAIFIVDGHAFGLWAKNTVTKDIYKIFEHNYKHCYLGDAQDSGLHLANPYLNH